MAAGFFARGFRAQAPSPWMRASIGILVLLSACASPPEGLWPASADERGVFVAVSSDAWHSRVALPAPGGGWVEWGYGERAWYYEGKQGISGVFRALLWPTAGVVDVRRVDVPYARRLPPGEGRLWTFMLSRRGEARLRAWLDGSRASEDPLGVAGGATWYAAARGYHVFHTCHHWVADALWEAGIPVRAACCWLPRGLWGQLDRLQALEDAVPAPAP